MTTSRRAMRNPPYATEHQNGSKTLTWTASADWLKSVTTCTRCGANRFCEMGERLPYVCTPTPQWLRDHLEDNR